MMVRNTLSQIRQICTSLNVTRHPCCGRRNLITEIDTCRYYSARTGWIIWRGRGESRINHYAHGHVHVASGVDLEPAPNSSFDDGELRQLSDARNASVLPDACAGYKSPERTITYKPRLKASSWPYILIRLRYCVWTYVSLAQKITISYKTKINVTTFRKK